VLCVRGGYGSGRIIKSIDFKKLQATPKVFVGSSDLTTILNGCLLHAGLTAFHGPTMQSLSDRSLPEFTLNSWIRQISGDTEALGSIKKGCPTDKLQVEVLQTGTASGRLIGGNLAVLLSSLGTPFFPSLDDSILFLEDIGETPFRIDRNLTHLLNIGALNKVQGFALGVFEKCAYRPDDAVKKQSLRDVVIDRLVPLGKPVVLGLPFGHTAYNATLPMGTTVTLDGENGDLLIEELGVR
jgi:muramoyltetrapeptide carboxypeptidase